MYKKDFIFLGKKYILWHFPSVIYLQNTLEGLEAAHPTWEVLSLEQADANEEKQKKNDKYRENNTYLCIRLRRHPRSQLDICKQNVRVSCNIQRFLHTLTLEQDWHIRLYLCIYGHLLYSPLDMSKNNCRECWCNRRTHHKAWNFKKYQIKTNKQTYPWIFGLFSLHEQQ